MWDLINDYLVSPKGSKEDDFDINQCLMRDAKYRKTLKLDKNIVKGP